MEGRVGVVKASSTVATPESNFFLFPWIAAGAAGISWFVVWKFRVETMSRSALLGFAMVIVAGCSGGSGTPSTDGGGGTSTIVGSCTGGKESGCTETLCCQDYAGIFTSTTAQSSCTAIAGTYSSAPCTSQNLAGSCALYEGTAAEQIVRYYVGYTFLDTAPGAASAAANCAALHIGTYIP